MTRHLKSKSNAVVPSGEAPWPLVGSHVSVAGGLDKGVARAVEAGCDCIQVFTKNNNQWNAKPLTEEGIAAWKAALAASSLRHPIAHASYLINLAAPDDVLWQKSIDALVVELQRGDALSLEGLVVHPGAFTTSDEATGMQRIVAAIDKAFQQYSPQTCRLLLENTAGQGSCLGHTFPQLGWLLDNIQAPAQVGVCLDTCHAFAAGHAIETEAGFRAMRAEIDDYLPSGCIKALHLNDSKKGCGSRVDRHEHIGEGLIGKAGFLHLFADPLLRNIPGYLETPKGEDSQTGEDLDHKNLRILREIAAAAQATTSF